ncbi:MAG: ribose-phosphate pyrophosphokinase-like domain-containing protein, partial [Thermotogaceae bacterium]|nr:ribose-phosphate pyrophosphokinase-like domain-containing protein [Thermotogaceae bacterium]
MPFSKNELKIFSGNSNRALAEKVAKHVGIELGDCDVGRFADGEINVRIN